MNKIKKISFIWFFVLLLMTGCSGGSKENSGDYITLYVFDTKGTELLPIERNIAGDDEKTKVLNCLLMLSEPPENGEYKEPLSRDTNVLSVIVRDGTAFIDFDASYENQKTPEPLVRAAVVRTLCQIDGVSYVNISVEGNPLTDSLSNIVGDMNEDSFIYDFENRDIPNQSADLTLYYPAADGSGLYREVRHVLYNSNTPLGKVVLSELLKSPENEEAIPVFPTDLTVNSYAVSEGICFVSFDSSLSSQILESSGNLPVMAVVNSLTEISGIKKVMINDPSHVGGLYEKDTSIVLNLEEENIE